MTGKVFRAVRTNQSATIEVSREVFDTLKSGFSGTQVLNVNSGSKNSVIINIDEIKCLLESAAESDDKSATEGVMELMDALQSYCKEVGIDIFLINNLHLLEIYYV
jgi:hypothetical protein